MVENEAPQLSAGEAELYDRQIRLWGLESQKRLRAARILLVGLNGLGAEVAKNIILAGIKAITLMDDRNVTPEDSASQFLCSTQDVGQNRAEASLQRARALNPNVEITADNSKVETKTDEFFESFDVVCVIEQTIDVLININNICRKLDIKFLCGDVWGMFGYTFGDLKNHEYAEDVITYKTEKSLYGKSKSITVTTTKKGYLAFVPLKSVMTRDYKAANFLKSLKRNGPCYLAMRVLHKFRTKFNRDPLPSTKEEDIKELNTIRKLILSETGIEESLFTEDFFSHVVLQISPTCAILGGILGHEIIKAVSQREKPHDNLFFFNPQNCSGFVDCDLGLVGNHGKANNPLRFYNKAAL